jgi:hypothetical protein
VAASDAEPGVGAVQVRGDRARGQEQAVGGHAAGAVPPPPAAATASRPAVVERLTAIAAAAVDPALAGRTWVLLTEAPAGGWGLNGTRTPTRSW